MQRQHHHKQVAGYSLQSLLLKTSCAVLALAGMATAAEFSAPVAGNTSGDTARTTAPTTQLAAGLPQSDGHLARLEQAMVRQVNAERAKAGLKPLEIDAKLADTARGHSAEMRDLNYFAHQSPTAARRRPADRYQAVFGSAPRLMAENILRAWGSGASLREEAVDTWQAAFMNSSGHRSNILYPDVTHIGIGIVTNANGDVWITQMFSQPEGQMQVPAGYYLVGAPATRSAAR